MSKFSIVAKLIPDTPKQKSYVHFTFMSVDSKYMHAFHSNIHITSFDFLAMLCIKLKLNG